jgi:hypothetical protein
MPDSQAQTPAQRAIGDFAPKLVTLTDDVLFGDVWPESCRLGRSVGVRAADLLVCVGGRVDWVTNRRVWIAFELWFRGSCGRSGPRRGRWLFRS